MNESIKLYVFKSEIGVLKSMIYLLTMLIIVSDGGFLCYWYSFLVMGNSIGRSTQENLGQNNNSF